MAPKFVLDVSGAEPRLQCGAASVPVNPEEFRVWALFSGINLQPLAADKEELLLDTDADRLYVAATWLD